MAYITNPVTGALVDTTNMDPATIAQLQGILGPHAGSTLGTGTDPMSGAPVAPTQPFGPPTPANIPGMGNPGPINPPPAPQPPAISPGDAAMAGFGAEGQGFTTPKDIPNLPGTRQITTNPDGTTNTFMPAIRSGLDWARSQFADGPPQPPPAAAGPSQPPPAGPVGPPQQTPAALPPPSPSPAVHQMAQTLDQQEAAQPPPPASPMNNALQAGATPGAPAQFDDWWTQVKQQESGGQQFNKDGTTKVSSAGAIGLTQIMRGTAKEMAASLGVPYDENRLRTEPAYNEALGKAYGQQMMQRYQDPVLAAAAYNAGPGKVDEWLTKYGDPRKGTISDAQWASQIPIVETRNYASKFAGMGHVQFAQNTAGPPTATDAVHGAPAPQEGQGGPQGGRQNDLAAFLNPAQFPIKPPMSDKLLALASGLLGARTLGEGAGAASKNLLDLNQQYRNTALHAGTTVANMQAMGMKIGIQQGRLDETRSNNTWRQGGGPGIQTENNKDADEIVNSGRAAQGQLETLQPLQQLLAANEGNPGPDAMSQARRWISNRLGLPIGDSTPTGQELAQMLSQSIGTKGISEAMKGTGLRTQREFDVFQSAVPGLARGDKQALQTMYNLMARRAQFNAATYQKFMGMDPQQQQEQVFSQREGVNRWRAAEEKNYLDSIDIPTNGQGASGPALQKGPSGWQVLPSGVKFQVHP